jgi:hypothetical protein
MSYQKKNNIREVNMNLEIRFLNEQTVVPLMTVLSTPNNVAVNAQDNTDIIFLTMRDKTGKIVPNSKYSYKVRGKKGFISFDITLRKVKRLSNGDLSAEAYPKSDIMKGLLSLIPSKYKTADGYVKILVPNAKITEAIKKLQENKGVNATVDAGNGIDVVFKLIQ